MTHRIKTIAIAATASALTVAGLAVAHGGDGRGDRNLGPSPFAFAGGKGLTYSETHFRRNGEDVTLRVDRGKVVAASASSIAIVRNDGETVEVPVDDDTKVLGSPRSHHARAAHRKRGDNVAQISEGKRVIVLRSDDDEAAEAIAVVGRHWHKHRFDRDDDRDHDRH